MKIVNVVTVFIVGGLILYCLMAGDIFISIYTLALATTVASANVYYNKKSLFTKNITIINVAILTVLSIINECKNFYEATLIGNKEKNFSLIIIMLYLSILWLLSKEYKNH